MPRKPERKLAPHVQAAIAAGQGKMGGRGGGREAAHVQAAIAAGRGVGQAKMRGHGGRSVFEGDMPGSVLVCREHLPAGTAGSGGFMFGGCVLQAADFDKYDFFLVELDKMKRHSGHYRNWTRMKFKKELVFLAKQSLYGIEMEKGQRNRVFDLIREIWSKEVGGEFPPDLKRFGLPGVKLDPKDKSTDIVFDF